MAGREAGDMGMRKDPRVQRTKRALRNALVSLICDGGFDAVTVRDIAERAEVNRATFYRHFGDKYELLRWTVEETFADLAWRPVPEDPADFTLDDLVDHAEAVFTRIAEHAGICRAVFTMEGGSALAIEARRLIEQIMHHRLQAIHLAEPLVPEEIITATVVHGFMGSVGWWLRHGMPHSPREMATHVIRLHSLGPYRCLGLDELAGDQGESAFD